MAFDHASHATFPRSDNYYNVCVYVHACIHVMSVCVCACVRVCVCVCVCVAYLKAGVLALRGVSWAYDQSLRPQVWVGPAEAGGGHEYH